MKQLSDKKQRHILYETNVCAGLPIIKTLQDLKATGDRIYSIQGVFSGTLSYLFNQLSAGVSFSKAISQAMEKGLTEPDPRDDLSGVDVARKCVCLARELGFQTELSDVFIQPILPESLMQCDLPSFLSDNQALDDVFSDESSALLQSQLKLVYLGQVNAQGQVELQLKKVDNSSPFFNLSGTDNMVIFHTERYDKQPLIVQGPGAGAEVTAAGVFADILRLAEITYD